MNLCTSTLSRYDFDQAIEIAQLSGCQGIELRISDEYHVSLQQALRNGYSIYRTVKAKNLELSVLNSDISVEDTDAVDQLLKVAKIMRTSQVRVVLPRATHRTVAFQTRTNEGVVLYENQNQPIEIIDRLKVCLKKLEVKAERAGVQILLELRRGTVMSSFSSAYFLVMDLNPKWIGITFNPANMHVNMKEDWKFGLSLIGNHIANVHVKNVLWKQSDEGMTRCWKSLERGVVDWGELITILDQSGYTGKYAIEDFLTPQNHVKHTIDYIKNFTLTLQKMVERNLNKLPVFQGGYNQNFEFQSLS